MDEVLTIFNFAPRDLWLAYKEFSQGSYYKDEAAKVRFHKKVFRVCRVIRVIRVNVTLILLVGL